MLAHTRWASVGIISEANAHPLNQEELDGDGPQRRPGPYVIAALNGDVDNYADLKALDGLHFPAEITTDAKVIPALVVAPHRRRASTPPRRSARRSRRSRDRSRSAAVAGADPDRIFLALRGSGQALYVGLGDDCFVVASEPYGLVEECDRYLRLDGETMLEAGEPGDPGSGRRARRAPRGHARRDHAACRTTAASSRSTEAELQTPEITTRDVDRGDAPHYLLKEITEAPASFRKTLRGRIVERDGLLDVRLPPD